MHMRFYHDPATGEPHIYNHGVTEEEVEEVIRRPGEDRRGREDARVAIGQTRAGRFLRVIYVPDPELESIFVITAYELRGEAADRLSTAAASERGAMRPHRFPPGWDEERVQKVLAHYEEQTEDEAVAEDEAAFEDATQTMMEVPHELVPAIRELIAKHHA
jgi:hypothetical protein